MDNRRLFLYALLGFVVYTMWSTWQQEHQPVTPPAPASQVTSQTSNGLLPTIQETAATGLPLDNEDAHAQTNQAKQLIHVKTDVLDLAIDTQEGNVVEAKLLNYPVSISEPQTPFALLYENPSERYIANSSLLINTEKGPEPIQFNYSSQQNDYQLEPGKDELVITLQGQSTNGLNVKKTFVFNRGSYLIRVGYNVDNTSDKVWRGYMNNQLVRTAPANDPSSMFQVGSYTGASYSNPGKHRYQKVSFKDMQKTNLNADVNGGWIAMQQHYFLSAWVPDDGSKNLVYSRNANDDYTIGSVGQALVVEPGKSEIVGASLYLGPEDTSVLKNVAPGLDLTVDYGWLWFLSSAIFSLMKMIYSFVGNWGWSIVLVTVLIKLAFYRLSATSYKSMANMRKLQPKLLALRDRYGDDKARISQATMELYRQEKVNPLGGCLPILIQIPVFIALYWVLIESVELRQAPFIFWINDLAVADPYHVLPVIMGITMFIQQRLNPAPPDPTQAKIMMFLPVLFTALFWGFPAGLVLYWTVNNTLSIAQQWYITRKYSDEKPKLIPAK